MADGNIIIADLLLWQVGFVLIDTENTIDESNGFVVYYARKQCAVLLHCKLNIRGCIAAMQPIAVIFTGGTICCRTDDRGTRHSDAAQIGYLLTEEYHKAHGDAQPFLTQMPMDSLSENLQPMHWDIMLDAMRKIDVLAVSGIIIAHGTDSLAETAAMLSCALLGFSLPVVLVSAHTPPDQEYTNAHSNFAAAVAMIQKGLPCGVWVVYENLDGVVYLHHAARLRACANESNEFFSRDMQPCAAVEIAPLQPAPWHDAIPMEHMRPFAQQPGVLLLRPYVGQRYDHVVLDHVAAVVHGTYHSETANSCGNSPYSVRYLLQKTKARQIPCFLAPCNRATQQYDSAENLVSAGITPLTDASVWLAYGAAMVGIALGYTGDALCRWVVKICQRFER